MAGAGCKIDVGLHHRAGRAVDDGEGRIGRGACRISFDIAHNHAPTGQSRDGDVVQIECISAIDGGGADAEVVGGRGAVGVENPAFQRHRVAVIGVAVIGPYGHPAAIGQRGDDGRGFPDRQLGFVVIAFNFRRREDGIPVLIQHSVDGFVEARLGIAARPAHNNIAAGQLRDGHVVDIGAVGAIHRHVADGEIVGHPGIGGGVIDTALQIHRGDVVRGAILGPDEQHIAIAQHGGDGRRFKQGGIIRLYRRRARDDVQAVRRRLQHRKDRLVVARFCRVADIRQHDPAIVQQIKIEVVPVVTIKAVDRGQVAKADLAGRGGAVGVEDPRLQVHRRDVVIDRIIRPDIKRAAIRKRQHLRRGLIARLGGVDLSGRRAVVRDHGRGHGSGLYCLKTLGPFKLSAGAFLMPLRAPFPPRPDKRTFG